MTDLPPGWEQTTIGEIADIQLGRQRSPKNHNGPHMRPYLRSANVTWNGIDVSDVKTMNFEPAEAATFELQPGDLLLNEASGSPGEVGKPAIWEGQIDGCCFQNTLLRVRSRGPHTGYLYWYCKAAARSGAFGEAGRGVNIRHLGKKGLSAFPIVLPPLAEQERIVAAIEEHVSHLEAGRAALASCAPRLRVLRATTISRALDAGEWPLAKWGDVGTTLSGRAFPSASYTNHGIPLLRPGNLDSSGEVRWTNRATTFLPVRFATENPRYHLQGRHLLMNLTAQSLADDFLGRVCLTSKNDDFLLNQRIASLASRSAQISYLYWVFRSARFRSFVAKLNTGSLIQHISTKQLDDFAFPCPPVDEQERIAAEIADQITAVDRLEQQLHDIGSRADPLWHSLLTEALSGNLEPQHSTEEPASVLMDRIRAGRATTPTSTRSAKAAIA